MCCSSIQFSFVSILIPHVLIFPYFILHTYTYTQVEESGIWSQHVSMEPATRMDVIELQEKLDAKLSERKAREAGLCPVREELYSQAFDELIRQVALEGPERGLLMMRTRDELRMTIDAYKTLFASAGAFGIKKQLQVSLSLSPRLKGLFLYIV